ncbi:hypothetical protein GOP47_0023313 [Adiantum capillus-veneris]|uniref:Uncharacterized protein n=1 Tax=Adiantum capillus-veneris TaxID=13818 RepID=A0A9D4U918_ADICA|nr:hypothetical protein GOP47_0023313 [Adiantum capillus-veneris]
MATLAYPASNQRRQQISHAFSPTSVISTPILLRRVANHLTGQPTSITATTAWVRYFSFSLLFTAIGFSFSLLHGVVNRQAAAYPLDTTHYPAVLTSFLLSLSASTLARHAVYK